MVNNLKGHASDHHMHCSTQRRGPEQEGLVACLWNAGIGLQSLQPQGFSRSCCSLVILRSLHGSRFVLDA